MNILKTVLVGAGGYAASYVERLFTPVLSSKLQLVAVVDPYATTSPQYEMFKHLPVYDTLEEFFAQNSAEFVIISSPIQLHYQQCVTALKNNAHILCEKPLVPTLLQLEQLADMAKSTEKILEVGFQLSYASAILSLKNRIIAGEFGRALSLKAIVSWQKDWAYYTRNTWAGKRKTTDGLLVNDAVASNATSHYIHNMLFVLGNSIATAAPLTNLTVECYRANDIETFDTIAFRGQAAGAQIFFAATHAADGAIQPRLEYAFENARIVIDFEQHNSPCVIYHNCGKIEHPPHDMHDGELNKIAFTAECIHGLRTPICDTGTVRPITALLDTIFSDVQFKTFDNGVIVVDKQKEWTYIKDLQVELMKCFTEEKLPSELPSWVRLIGK